MALSKYNKDRPFLMVNIIHMAPEKSATHTKDYGKTGKWLVGEQISIEDCVKNKHMTQCAVIIDILKSKIIKNRLEKTDQEVLHYFVTKYKREITDGIQVWMRKRGMSVTPQQINKIERNINKSGAVGLALEEGDSEDISKKIFVPSADKLIEDHEKQQRKRRAEKNPVSDKEVAEAVEKAKKKEKKQKQNDR